MDIIKKYRYVRKKIKKASNIFIMGHKGLDLDAIGSALAFYNLVEQLGKKAYIILNDKKHEAGVSKVLNLVKNDINFVTSKEVNSLISTNDLLIIVDVNKPCIMQDEKIVSKFNTVLLFDHHEKTNDTINATVEIIHPRAGSTSEIITEYMHYFNYKVPPEIATFLLAGITLDTNNFTVKTTDFTHYAAYFLIEMGASVKNVNILLKQDIEEYVLRQKVITEVEVLNKTVAFAKGSSRIFYKREELAKIADTLLEFNNIETSYVIGRLSEEEIGISARSSGNVNIGEVLSLLGGGGDRYDAACVLTNISLKETEEKLKKILGEIT